jgi:DNA-binding transcriptional MerR regulator
MNKYTVSQMSKLTNLSSYTLRYYERIGLLPDIARDNNGYRIYDDNDIALIRFLNCLKEAGMPVKTMVEFMRLMYAGENTIPLAVPYIAEATPGR